MFKTYSPDDDKNKKQCEEPGHPIEDPEEDPEKEDEEDEEELEKSSPNDEKPEEEKKQKAPSAMVSSVYGRLWAIKTEKLFELSHWPEKLTVGFSEIFDDMDRNFDCEPTITPNGTAIINVFGVMDQRTSLFQWLFGGCSTERLYGQIEKLVSRQEIKQIALNFATPGGAVDGIETLAGLIYSVRDKKPIIGFANSFCFSGGIWLATACSKFYMASNTAMAGSIGVVTAHQDVSKAEEMFGIKTTEITAGKYKRIDSKFEPLSAEGREYLQDRVDYVYTVFVDAVARNRGKSSQEVLEKMADGKIFVGAQAVDVGLADGILSIEDFLKGEAMQEKQTVPAQPQQAAAQVQTEVKISEEYLAKHAPELFDSIKAKAREDGARAERERIQAIEANTLPGYEKLAASVKFDGKTTGDQLALMIFKKQKEDGVSLSQLRAEAKIITPAPTAPGSEEKNALVSAMLDGMESAAKKKAR